jgi:hypothetical protein
MATDVIVDLLASLNHWLPCPMPLYPAQGASCQPYCLPLSSLLRELSMLISKESTLKRSCDSIERAIDADETIAIDFWMNVIEANEREARMAIQEGDVGRS